MKMRKSVLTNGLLVVILLSSAGVWAQCKDWKWPEDAEQKAKAEEKVSLYDDYRKNGEYAKAKTHLNWLLTNIPELNTSIYINGAEILDKLATDAKDPAVKNRLVDSLLLIHDLRIQYCGEEASVTNRKALMALKYWANENGKEAYTLGLLDKAFELNGNNILDGTLIPYMQVVKINKLKLKNLTDEQVLERYDMVMEILDAKIKKAASEGKPTDRYRTWKEDTDKILISMIKVDCDFVRTNLGPKFKANPSDIGLAKKIFAFMLQDKCTNDPLWLQAAEEIHKVEKDYGLAKNLAIRYLASENYSKAESYFKEALELAPSNQDKADVNIYLGSLETRKGNKVGARDLFRQALSADPNKKEAYEKIGDLYYQSFADCAKQENMADDRLVYLAAYDMYQKAGDSKKMTMAKDQFPSREDIFLVNYTAGQTIRVACWINETTTIRTRD